MNQPDFFEGVAFTAAPGARNFQPKPTETGKRRVLFRCTARKCKFCKAADISARVLPSFMPGAPARHVLEGTEIDRVRATVKCPDHPAAYLRNETVEGTLSKSHECDPRCTTARGPICVCACAGANHGGAWL